LLKKRINCISLKMVQETQKTQISKISQFIRGMYFTKSMYFPNTELTLDRAVATSSLHLFQKKEEIMFFPYVEGQKKRDMQNDCVTVSENRHLPPLMYQNS